MKISPKLLSELFAQGDAVSVKGRYFIAVEALERLDVDDTTAKRAEPTDEKAEPKGERKG